MYVYRPTTTLARSDSVMLEVGYHSPTNNLFVRESIHQTPEAAAARVAWLNGSNESQAPTQSTRSYVLTDGTDRVAMRTMTEDEADVENRRAEGASDGNFRWEPIVTERPKPKMTVRIKRDGHDTLDHGERTTDPFEIFMEPYVEYVEFRVDNIEIGRVYRPRSAVQELLEEAGSILDSTGERPSIDIHDIRRSLNCVINAMEQLVDQRKGKQP